MRGESGMSRCCLLGGDGFLLLAIVAVLRPTLLLRFGNPPPGREAHLAAARFLFKWRNHPELGLEGHDLRNRGVCVRLRQRGANLLDLEGEPLLLEQQPIKGRGADIGIRQQFIFRHTKTLPVYSPMNGV